MHRISCWCARKSKTNARKRLCYLKYNGCPAQYFITYSHLYLLRCTSNNIDYLFSIHKNNHLIVCSQQNISYLCNSPLRVSMCYGTLPRGEVQASSLLFYKFSCLEEWSHFAFFINPHLLYIGIDICSCNNIFTDKPITASFYVINHYIWRLFHSM